MSGSLSINIDFKDSYYKKLGLKSRKGFDDALNNAVDHTIHDAENVCRREAPIDTGNLRRSIHKNKPRPCVAELRSRGAPYWVYLQWGTSKMSANPFVTRTARKVCPRLSEYVLEELKRNGTL